MFAYSDSGAQVNRRKKILDDFGKLWYIGLEFKHYFVANRKGRLGYMKHNKNILFFSGAAAGGRLFYCGAG